MTNNWWSLTSVEFNETRLGNRQQSQKKNPHILWTELRKQTYKALKENSEKGQRTVVEGCWQSGAEDASAILELSTLNIGTVIIQIQFNKKNLRLTLKHSIPLKLLKFRWNHMIFYIWGASKGVSRDQTAFQKNSQKISQANALQQPVFTILICLPWVRIEKALCFSFLLLHNIFREVLFFQKKKQFFLVLW